MNSITKELISSQLDKVVEPQLKWNLNTLGLVKDIQIEDSKVSLKVNLVTDNAAEQQLVKDQIKQVLSEIGCQEVSVEIGRVNIAETGIKGIKNIILVGSGKGGVGKSSVALNLAVAMQQQGNSVGLMDADIYGPSLPTLLDHYTPPEVLSLEFLQPVEAHGLKTMSVGYLVDQMSAVDWRGQMTSGTVMQFIEKTNWGKLDYLIIDLPPGTGDIQLTIMHHIKCDGAVLVTIPSQVALADVQRSLDLFKSREVPILGLVENMSYLICEKCEHHNQAFPTSSTNIEKQLGINILGHLPLDRSFAQNAEDGTPSILANPNSIVNLELQKIANQVIAQVADNKMSKSDNIAEQIA